jgi:hypothetical protein
MNPDIKMRAVLTYESGIARCCRVASLIIIEEIRATIKFKQISDDRWWIFSNDSNAAKRYSRYAKHGNDMNAERKSARAKADLLAIDLLTPAGEV